MVWRVFRKLTIMYEMNGSVTRSFGNIYVNVADFFLRLIGYKAEINYEYNFMGIPGGEGVVVEFDCMAFSVMALFSIFVIAYPGSLKVKSWYIPLGLVVIFFINAFRIAALTLVVHFLPQYMDLFHHFIFQALVYFFVILMWLFWIKKLEVKVKMNS